MAYNMPDNLLESLSPISVGHYVERQGWRLVTTLPGRCSLYRSASHDGEIVIPLDTTFGDYSRRIAEVIQTLSIIEDRSSTSLLYDLIGRVSDVFKFRVTGTATEDGNIPLNDAVNLLANARKALMAAACDVLKPERFHKRLSRREAEQFINNCHLGQSDKGSYVSRVICPIDIADYNANLTLFPSTEFPELKPDTFARQVTSKMMLSVHNTINALNSNSPEIIMKPNSEDEVISANFLEAIGNMEPLDTTGQLHISVAWSTMIAMPPHKIQTVSIQRRQFEEVRRIAESLRPRLTPSFDTFIGRVQTLSGDPDEDNLMAGEVILNVIARESDETLKLKVYLSPDDYQVACDAHKLGKVIAISGELHRGDRIHIIYNYKGFQVLPT